jgi:hypothetical protein
LRRRLVDEEVGDEYFMPTNTIPIPIIVNIVIMFSYIAIGAFVFSDWEEWDVASGAYFSFITLLTIGFGDLVKKTLKKDIALMYLTGSVISDVIEIGG